MMQQETLDECSIDTRSTQSFTLHPVAEMREAAQIGAEGVSGIAPVLQRLDVQSEEFVQRAIRQPVTADKVRQAEVGGHGGLLE